MQASRSEVPNLGYMYPQEYIYLSEGVHLRLAIEEKNIFTKNIFRFLQNYLYVYQ